MSQESESALLLHGPQLVVAEFLGLVVEDHMAQLVDLLVFDLVGELIQAFHALSIGDGLPMSTEVYVPDGP